VGWGVGIGVGWGVGIGVGWGVGIGVGVGVAGTVVGSGDGMLEGIAVGNGVGMLVGMAVGIGVGDSVGAAVWICRTRAWPPASTSSVKLWLDQPGPVVLRSEDPQTRPASTSTAAVTMMN